MQACNAFAIPLKEEANVQNLIMGIPIRLRAIATCWESTKEKGLENKQRPHWIIGLKHEIIWLRRYVGIAKVSGLAIQIPECLIELDRFLDNSDVLELLPKIVGPLGDNYAKLTGLDNAWWEDDDPLLPAVTYDGHALFRKEIRRRLVLCRESIEKCSIATNKSLERAESDLAAVANAIGHLHQLNGQIN